LNFHTYTHKYINYKEGGNGKHLYAALLGRAQYFKNICDGLIKLGFSKNETKEKRTLGTPAVN